ncbi:MAG: class I SAM-dependent methyltransferase [Chitinispirillaceae bacterium]|nr:class I SAM-dependent methyltransferase [Chitinispirillaceae bacterium]
MSSTAYMPIVGCSSDPPRPGAYQSRMMERYRHFLGKCDDPRILDSGPVCGKNIEYLLSRFTRIFVCDIMQRLTPEPLHPIEPEALTACLDFEEGSFDGIHVWDIPDHLDDMTLKVLVARCCSFLRPNGLLMLIASTTKSPQPYQHYLAFNDESAAILSRSTSFRLPYFHRSNRDIEIAMKPLVQYCSFVCMNGIREFLFKKAF